MDLVERAQQDRCRSVARHNADVVVRGRRRRRARVAIMLGIVFALLLVIVELL